MLIKPQVTFCPYFGGLITFWRVRDMTIASRIAPRDPTFGEFVPRLGFSETFGKKFGELRYLGIF